MEKVNTNTEVVETNKFTHFVGVKFLNGSRAYFFGVKDLTLNLEDKVVVDTARGIELGEVVIPQTPIKKYKNNLPLKQVVRLATDVDIKVFQINQKDAVYAMEICKAEVQKLNLDMHIISCEYTLDKSNVFFAYLADDRVDFRNLLKVLAPKLHTRIELRQIGSRDKAKMIGGLGVCGQKLCCSTFLNEFDGISINRAKNQMLAINVPKLSGHCGKLICCLKFEDDAYTEERKKYPPLGTKVLFDGQEFVLTNINIISKMVKIENQEDVKFMSFDDLKKQAKFKIKREKNEEK